MKISLLPQVAVVGSTWMSVVYKLRLSPKVELQSLVELLRFSLATIFDKSNEAFMILYEFYITKFRLQPVLHNLDIGAN